MASLLHKAVARLVRTGALTVTDPDGTTRTYGDGSGRPVHVAIRTHGAARAIALDPMLAMPEAYMDGEFDVVEGDLIDFLQIAFTNLGNSMDGTTLPARMLEGARYALRRLQQFNTAGRSRQNVHRHYDLSGEMYRLFLDADMQYSCAYYARPDMTLEEAQEAKKQHIVAKLNVGRGNSVLDIGSGWGGLAAREIGCRVTGLTISREQHDFARERIHKAGLADKVEIKLQDYRHETAHYDRIVSVGMFEHVGVNHYRTFFDKCATLLKPDGVMLLHTIGRSGPPAATNAFIRKYIFPGGYIPALSEVMPAIEKAGLVVTDVEILRLHYAETLKAWRERFMANRKRAVEIYDERFARMWEFYLAGSEASFRWQDMVNFQIQITKRNDTLPITREYIHEGEMELAHADKAASTEAAAPAPKPAAKPAPRKRRSTKA